MLSPSVNNMYEKSVYKNQRTKKSFVNVSLSEKVEAFRLFLKAYIRRNEISFKTDSIVACIVEIYTPKWLNKDMTPSKMDCDNMIKSLFDGVEKALEFPDELIFHHHPFKMYGEEDYIKLTLFELEPVIFRS